MDLARSVGKYFRLSEALQDEVIRTVLGAVKGWEKGAAQKGFKRSEMDLMRVAFRAAE